MNGDLHSLAGLYALDALDELDTARFERHLAQCEQCRTEVREFQETAHRLAAPEAATPPARLRNEVLAAVAVTPQVRRRDWRRARGARAVTAVLGAAAVLIVAVLGVALVRSRTELSETRRILAAMSDPAASTARLEGEFGVTATLVASAGSDELVVALAGLPAVTSDRAYAVWLISAEGPTPMTLLRPDRSGRALALLEVDLDHYVGFGLTNEPAGGSPAPTGPLLVSGGLPEDSV